MAFRIVVLPFGLRGRPLLRAFLGVTALAFAPSFEAGAQGPSADDPVLALAMQTASGQVFREAVAAAVARHPSLTEAQASETEAAAARREAKAGWLPTLDVSATSYHVLARKFSDDPDNVYERSRANSRSDFMVSLSQKVIDFGATSERIAASGARLRAAAASVDVAADQIALRMIAAWYDVFTYRALVRLVDTHSLQQQALRRDVQTRIDQGYSASGDLIRVDSALAETAARAATYRRQLAGAEARFYELAGLAPPPGLTRAPPAGAIMSSADMARAAALRAPAVRAADAVAEGARQDARAARADGLPTITAGIDGGRYGIFENRQDYDVRANVTLRQRFSGAIYARASQVSARSAQAAARADRVREEASRDAAIAWTDAQALDSQVAALEASYVAGRASRDMLVERFRLARGTLFDVLGAEDAAFSTAAAYIEALGDRDAARYALLSRTGRLLPSLGIAQEAPTLEERR
jgi:adhesin transport system outer membrane protein